MIRQPIIVVMGHVDHGKCVSGDSMLELGDGRLEHAESVFEEFKKGQPTEQNKGLVYEAKNLSLLSVDENNKVKPKRVTHVWKLKSDRLINVTTKAGYSIKTTPEHRFFILTKEGKTEYIESERLKLGDSLLIPIKTETSFLEVEEIGKLILRKLPDSFLLKVSEKLNDKIAKFAKNRVYKLGKEIGDKSLEFHLRKGFYRVSILRKLIVLLDFSEDKIYDHIEKIKFASNKQRASHKSFWLKIPHRLSEFESLFYIIGLLYGDGVRENAYLSNVSETIIRKYRRCLMDAFGINASVTWKKTAFLATHTGGKTFSRFLISAFDYPSADKSTTIKVPDIVCMSSNALLKNFIRGFFDAEGFAEGANYTGSIGVGCNSAVLMKQFPSLLHRFGCLSYFVKRHKRAELELTISGSENLTAYSKNIGFTEPRKTAQLARNIEKAVSSRIFDTTPISGRFVTDLRENYGVSGKRGFDLSYYESKTHLTKHALQILLMSNENTKILPLASLLSSYKMVQVTGLETLEGDFSVYDFTIDKTHNFIANNLIVHNTSLLDKIRSTTITAREAGGITQHIGASEVPIDVINKTCGPLLKASGMKITLPGLLFIDTPGHEAFTNLRKRGGSVADIAIVVVDVSKGFEPQTLEAINILKEYKTPFVIAANKVDLITGWIDQKTSSVMQSLAKQNQYVQNEFTNRMYQIVGRLSELGFSSELFNQIKDFKSELAIIPLSAKTGEGIAELLMVVTGLAQKYLESELKIEVSGPGKGSILEKKEVKGLGMTLDVILYDGTLHVNDIVAFAVPNGVATAKIKALLKPKPLTEIRESSSNLLSIDSVAAASGVKISGVGLDEAMPGSPIIQVTDKNYEKEIKSELTELFETDKKGVILKADSIGSIEAISRLLKAEGVGVSKKEIGNVTKRDLLDAFTLNATEPLNAVILAFNVHVDPDAVDSVHTSGVRVIESNIIYKLIDDYKLFADEKKKSVVGKIEGSTVFPGMIKILPNACFHVSSPAVFGVEVVAGRIKPGYTLMNDGGDIIGKIKEIQREKTKVDMAKKGEQLAVSVDGPTFGRQIKENQVLYNRPGDADERLLTYNFSHLLDNEEKELLKKISAIKRLPRKAV